MSRIVTTSRLFLRKTSRVEVEGGGEGTTRTHMAGEKIVSPLLITDETEDTNTRATELTAPSMALRTDERSPEQRKRKNSRGNTCRWLMQAAMRGWQFSSVTEVRITPTTALQRG
jgi:hypothetical protein